MISLWLLCQYGFRDHLATSDLGVNRHSDSSVLMSSLQYQMVLKLCVPQFAALVTVCDTTWHKQEETQA